MGKYALLVGTTKSQYEGLAPLAAPRGDIEAMGRALTSPFARFIVGESLDESCQDIRVRINQFFSNRQPEDIILLYVSGHGVRDSQTLYLVNRDTEQGKLPSTAIPSDFITRLMERCQAKKVVILDCCFSGAFRYGMSSPTSPFGEHFNGVRGVVMTSSSETQPSFEEKGLSLSAYTRILVQGLESEDGAASDSDDEKISVFSLHKYVLERSGAEWLRQTPKLFGDLSVDFEIARSRRPSRESFLAKGRDQVRHASHELLRALNQACCYSEVMCALGNWFKDRCSADIFYVYRSYRLGPSGLRLQASNDRKFAGKHIMGITASPRLIADMQNVTDSDRQPKITSAVAEILRPLESDAIRTHSWALMQPMWLGSDFLDEQEPVSLSGDGHAESSRRQHMVGLAVLLLNRELTTEQRNILSAVSDFASDLVTKKLGELVLRLPRGLTTNRYLSKAEKNTPEPQRTKIVIREIAQIFMADRAQMWLSDENDSPRLAAQWYSAQAYLRHDVRTKGSHSFKWEAEGTDRTLREAELICPFGKVHQVFYEEKADTQPDDKGEFQFIRGDPDVKCGVTVPIGLPGLICGVINLESYGVRQYSRVDSGGTGKLIDQENLQDFGVALNRVMLSVDRNFADDYAAPLFSPEERRDGLSRLGLTYTQGYRRFKSILYRGYKLLGAKQGFDFTSCILYLNDPVNECLRVVATVGCENMSFTPELLQYPYGVESSLTMETFRRAQAAAPRITSGKERKPSQHEIFIEDINDPSVANRIDTRRNAEFGHVGSMLAYPILSSAGGVRGVLILGTRDHFPTANRTRQTYPSNCFLTHLDLFCRNLGQMDQLYIPLHRKEVERHIKNAIQASAGAATDKSEAIQHLAWAVIAAGFRRARFFMRVSSGERHHKLVGSLDVSMDDVKGSDRDVWLYSGVHLERTIKVEEIDSWKKSSVARHAIAKKSGINDRGSFEKNGRDWALVPVIVPSNETHDSSDIAPTQVIGFITADKKPFLKNESDTGKKPEESKFSEESMSMLTLIGAKAGIVFERLAS